MLFVSCDCFRSTGNSAAHRQKHAVLKQSYDINMNLETWELVLCELMALSRKSHIDESREDGGKKDERQLRRALNSVADHVMLENWMEDTCWVPGIVENPCGWLQYHGKVGCCTSERQFRVGSALGPKLCLQGWFGVAKPWVLYGQWPTSS